MILTEYIVIVLLLGKYRPPSVISVLALMADVGTSAVIGLPTPEAEPEPIPEDTTHLGDALYASTHRALYREGGPNLQDMTQSK